MQKIWLLTLLCISLHGQAQWPWEKIEGNGHKKTENRHLGNFSAVASSGSWPVIISYASANSVQVAGDENLLQFIETTVENGKLSIKSKRNTNLRSQNKIVIYVTLSRLSAVSLSGSGNITGAGKFENEDNCDFSLAGSGNINVSFNKCTNVTTHISGSGRIQLTGYAETLDVRISGSGSADCSELTCNMASAAISGSGSVTVTANKSIDAKISGSGNLYYAGAATVIQKQIAGSGHVKKLL